MADQEQLAILKLGVEVWNEWRIENSNVAPNLRDADLSSVNLKGANLSETDLSGASLEYANLTEANLHKAFIGGATLKGAFLKRANLSDVNASWYFFLDQRLRQNVSEPNMQSLMRITDLSGTDLEEANISWASLDGVNLSQANLHNANLFNSNLTGTNLRDANLCGTNIIGIKLQEADLKGADLTGADLRDMNLGGMDLSRSNLTNTDLRRTRLIDSTLNEATLSGAKLWASQRDGWHIKGIICEQVSWDRISEKPTYYEPGEFERLHQEGLNIELFYEGGIQRFEILTLPMLLQHLEQKHKGCSLRLKSIEDAPRGAKVTIVVDESGGMEPKQLKDKLHESAQRHKIVLRNLLSEKNERTKLEGKLEFVNEVIIPMIERKMSDTNINAESVVNVRDISGNASLNINQSRTYTQDDLSIIKDIITEISTGHVEVKKELNSEKLAKLERAVKEIQEQLEQQTPNTSVIKEGLRSLRTILEGASANAVASGWLTTLQTLV